MVSAACCCSRSAAPRCHAASRASSSPRCLIARRLIAPRPAACSCSAAAPILRSPSTSPLALALCSRCAIPAASA
eukprot:scaffold51640_cov68-Phaeocystis_antarctica.AAC.2